jgi:SAM-dependent methyltransferase
MEVWRRALTGGAEGDATSAVVAELGEYFKLPADQVRERCENWTKYSLTEWESGDRTSSEGLKAFYDEQTSWIFDTMWYHAEQHHGRSPAEGVEVALGLSHVRPGRLLDFGAGPGSGAIFFNSLGWSVSLLDISKTMREFADWRLKRRNIQAPIYSSLDELPDQSFDLITAFDVMVHVPNAGEAVARLHRALAPGGYFVFNIDNRPKTLENHGHLYEDQWPILRTVRRTGFRRHPKIIYFHVYQRTERGLLEAGLVAAYDTVRYNRTVTRVGNVVRRLQRELRGIADRSPR